MANFVCKPFHGFHRYEVMVPGSKSMTNRALLIGALAQGKTVLRGVLFSEDSRVFMRALQDIGFRVEIEETEKVVTIEGLGGRLPLAGPDTEEARRTPDTAEAGGMPGEEEAGRTPDTEEARRTPDTAEAGGMSGEEEAGRTPDRESGWRKVYVGSAGTAARFLTAFLALSGQKFVVEASEQMKKRPMEPLLRALEMLGARFEYLEKPYSFPFRVCGREEKNPDFVELNIDASSQFLSALLLCGVMCREGVTIRLTGTRNARAYVGISMDMMGEFGCQTEQLDEDTYRVLPEQRYRGGEYQIEPDVSAACYFYGLAAVTGGEAKVMHVHRATSQGDIRFLDVLEKMGCQVREEADGIVVTGNEDGRLEGVHVCMSDFSDQTMTLAALAPFAQGDTVIDGVGHIRRQESDRIRGIVTELTRMGISCEEREDGLTIHPGAVRPTVVSTYDDHRMAMAFALTGCRAEGIVIDNPECCKKTFENYFDILTNLGLIPKI